MKMIEHVEKKKLDDTHKFFLRNLLVLFELFVIFEAFVNFRTCLNQFL